MKSFIVLSFFLSFIFLESLLANEEDDFHGCYKVDESTTRLDCTPIGLEEKMGCAAIRRVPPELQALTPKLPIVECTFNNEKQGSKAVLRRTGCGWIRYLVNYIVIENSKPKLIQSPEEFRQTFAPVDSESEALAFTIALTNDFPIYKIEIPDGYIRMVRVVEPTSTKRSAVGGYTVRLFNQTCGCGLHPFYSVDYHVDRDGNLTEFKQENVYRNPKEDNVCVE